MLDPHLHLRLTPTFCTVSAHRQSRRYLCHAPWTTPCDAASLTLALFSTELYASSLLPSFGSLAGLFSFDSTPRAIPGGLRKLADQDAGTALEPSDTKGHACCTCRSCWTAVGPGSLRSRNEAAPGVCALV